jgi:hypothetical protein
MSFGDELVKLSLSHGYSRLVGAVETIARAVEGPARSGVWETTVEFQGEWYEDDGNQKSIGIHLSDQEVFLVDVTRTPRGSLLFHVTWGEDVEWRKGSRERAARKEASKSQAKAAKVRDPNDPEYQEFVVWKARLESYKAEARGTPEYREWREAKKRHKAKKEAAINSGEFGQYSLEKHEARSRQKREALTAQLEEHSTGREKSKA